MLKLNPAFAGTGGRGRVSGIYRNQWPGLSSAYITSGVFYDQPVEFVHGGVGVQIINDSQGGNTFRWSSVALFYSYHLQAGKDLFILTGMDLELWASTLLDKQDRVCTTPIRLYPLGESDIKTTAA